MSINNIIIAVFLIYITFYHLFSCPFSVIEETPSRNIPHSYRRYFYFWKNSYFPKEKPIITCIYFNITNLIIQFIIIIIYSTSSRDNRDDYNEGVWSANRLQLQYPPSSNNVSILKYLLDVKSTACVAHNFHLRGIFPPFTFSSFSKMPRSKCKYCLEIRSRAVISSLSPFFPPYVVRAFILSRSFPSFGIPGR